MRLYHETHANGIAVVLLKSGPQEGHIAVIAEIIDHNRVLPKPLLTLPPFH